MSLHTQLALLAVPLLLVVIGWMIRQWHIGLRSRLDDVTSRLRALERESAIHTALERSVQALDRKVDNLERAMRRRLESEEGGETIG